MEHRKRLCASALSLLFASSANAGVEGGTHDLAVRFESSRPAILISDMWRMPVDATASSKWTFYLSPIMRDVRIRALRCGRRAMRLASIASRPDGGDMIWELRTTEPCPAGRRVSLAIAYRTGRNAPQLQVGRDRAFAGGGGEYWYPKRAWAPLETGILRLDIPTTARAFATGRLVHAAAAGGSRSLVYRVDRPSKFAFAFGPYSEWREERPFPMVTLTTQPVGRARETTIRLSRLIGPLEQAFGRAPSRPLGLVEVAFGGRVAGTSEYGMIFAEAEQISGAFNAAYWAHEFSHQWWGITVRARSSTPGAQLLTEGMAQYGALVALAATEGEEAAAAYRIGDKKDSVASYRKLIAAGEDRPLVGDPPKGQDEIIRMHRLMTSKGGILLSQLAWLIGQEKFHSLLRDFLRRHEGDQVTWADLESHLNAGTGGAYAWWFDQWLRRPGLPAYSVSPHIEGNSVTLTIRQASTPLYRLIIPIEACGAWGRERFSVESNTEQTVVSHAFRGPVLAIRVDPDVLVPNANPVESAAALACAARGQTLRNDS